MTNSVSLLTTRKLVAYNEMAFMNATVN